MFVEGFTCMRFGGSVDAGAGLAAVSNGIPGVPFAPRDGILVGTRHMETYPEDWTRVMAHELGHYLGLFHTQEPVSTVHDGLSDTPEGSAAQPYLMYWNVTTSASDLLSPQQGEVMRGSPYVQPAASR